METFFFPVVHTLTHEALTILHPLQIKGLLKSSWTKMSTWIKQVKWIKVWESQVRDSGSGGDHGEPKTLLLSRGPFQAPSNQSCKCKSILAQPSKHLKDDDMDELVMHRT